MPEDFSHLGKRKTDFWHLGKCQDNHVSAFKPSEAQVLDFLLNQFQQGSSYGSLNSIRSAISLISATKFGDSRVVCRFLKAFSDNGQVDPNIMQRGTSIKF